MSYYRGVFLGVTIIFKHSHDNLKNKKMVTETKIDRYVEVRSVRECIVGFTTTYAISAYQY
jgi:hypothetical protein